MLFKGSRISARGRCSTLYAAIAYRIKLRRTRSD
ncbi:hypothetical protein B398_01775 [Xylella fastidiosa 32]|nr:hypothetical protein B398_01775 [Xylella fastidiosa 32]